MPPSTARSRRAVRGALLVAAALLLGLSASTASAGVEADGQGILSVRPSPAVAAQIIVDGVARNQPEISELSLAVGRHQVCVTVLDGYAPVPCTVVDIAEGETTLVNPALERSGILAVRTDPHQSEAEITIDGVLRDVGAVQLPIGAGSHEICFGDVSRMSTPSCQRVDLVADATLEVVGSYAPVAMPSPESPSEEPSEPAGPGDTTTVATELRGTAERGGGNAPWSAVATIVVRDHGGRPVPGVSASGSWATSRPPAATVSACVTAADGTCDVHVRDMATGAGNTATFTVTSLADDRGVLARTGAGEIVLTRNGGTSVS